MIESLAIKLKIHHIVCQRNAFASVQLGFGKRSKPIILEPHLELRAGLIDADEVGAFTYLGGDGSSFRHVARIGRFCSIAGGIQTGQMEHPTDMLSMHSMLYGNWSKVWEGSPEVAAYYSENQALVAKAMSAAGASIASRSTKIEIGNDVWIGYGALIRRGVKIGDGAVIGSRAVVTKDVPPYAVVGGTPAKVLKYRFPPDVVERLMALRWWDYGLRGLNGIDITDLPGCIDRIEANLQGMQPWKPTRVAVHSDNRVEVVTPA
ncbi:CatB-related O-acetyltransferase [Cupriavidus nantongensis]|uniref:Chloramphenicol acetyltransferase n=1 Tax=Cupriavidus nantongensis TaxID=1796606 RepID=A0A142JTJ4_9BURK|nr:hypothetical protein A2G96_26780 [Cupriavidus nantongensis]